MLEHLSLGDTGGGCAGGSTIGIDAVAICTQQLNAARVISDFGKERESTLALDSRG